MEGQIGFALAVDVGTSNTVAVLRWPDGRTRPLLFDGQPILPSGVFLDAAGTAHTGWDAVRLSRADPGRYEPNPKRRVDDTAVLLGEREVGTAELLAAVLAAVARTATEAAGFLPPVVLTHPAAWGARRREVLLAAATQAGWPPGSALVPEPVAAARYFAEVLRRPVPVGAAIAVYDFGGGTLDVAVVRNSGSAGFVVLGSGGLAELGGLDLDAALVAHLGGLLAASAPQVWQALDRPQTLEQARARRRFWEDVRGAKEMLSRTSAAPVAVPGLDQAVHVTREELERLVTPLLRRGVAEAARVIAACQLTPHQLAGLFLVGGSSRVPLVARLLHAELGVAPTVLEQPELPVAEGAILGVPPAAQPGPATEPVSPAGSAAMAGAVPPAGSPLTGSSLTGAVTGGATGAAGSPGAAVGRASVAATAGIAAAGTETMTGLGSAAGPGVATELGTAAGPAGAGWTGAAAGSPAVPPGSAPPAEPPPHRPLHRRPLAWIVVAAATALLTVAGITAYILTRGPSDLPFQDVAVISRFNTGGNAPLHAYSYVTGDLAYLAWQHDDQLDVVAVKAGSGENRWRITVSGDSDSWLGVTAYPDVVFAWAYNASASEPRTVYALSPGTGDEMWNREVYGEDRLFVYDSIAVLADAEEDKLVGLDLRTGEERWSKDNPEDSDGNADASTMAASTVADQAGSADVTGSPYAPVLDDDYRIVQIGADRRARVIDARTGNVLSERGNVGDSSAKYLAYDGRLFVVASDGGYHVDAYDLDGMGDPRGVYRAADDQRLLNQIAPCGEDRVCVLDRRSSDEASIEVAAINTAEGGQVWRHPARDAALIVPVGEGVLVQRTSGTPGWALRAADGDEILNREGTAVRLDAGNILSFSGSMSSSGGLSVAGTGLRGHKARELGPLADARGETCAWNTHVIACLADKDFVLWRFAED